MTTKEQPQGTRWFFALSKLEVFLRSGKIVQSKGICQQQETCTPSIGAPCMGINNIHVHAESVKTAEDGASTMQLSRKSMGKDKGKDRRSHEN